MDSLLGLLDTHPFWFWVAAGGLLLAIEVGLGTGYLLWPAAAAGVVGVLTIFLPLSWPVALLVFAVITIAATLLSRRFLPKSVLGRGGDINDNVARLVGHHGKAVDTFANHAGRVFIDGKEWAARLDGSEPLEAGSEVLVVGVDGAHLRVKAAR